MTSGTGQACEATPGSRPGDRGGSRLGALLATVALVAAMFAGAGLARDPELVFPEIAALALGAWAMPRPPWRATALTIWLSPTLAALTGVLVLRLLPGSFPLRIGAAFLLVALELRALRSAVLPSLSAAMLPIVTRGGGWAYPLSVCALTAVIALGMRPLGPAARPEDVGPLPAPGAAGSAAGEALHWGKLLLGVLLVAALAWSSGWIFAVAPPLVVTFVELSRPGGALRARARLLVLLMALSAAVGVLWVLALRAAGAPVGLAGCGSLASVLLLFRVAGVTFPPAAAIGLLPTILPPGELSTYPLQVAAGAGVFWAASAVVSRSSGAALSPGVSPS